MYIEGVRKYHHIIIIFEELVLTRVGLMKVNLLCRGSLVGIKMETTSLIIRRVCT
jgi:hypothetical protein